MLIGQRTSRRSKISPWTVVCVKQLWSKLSILGYVEQLMGAFPAALFWHNDLLLWVAVHCESLMCLSCLRCLTLYILFKWTLIVRVQQGFLFIIFHMTAMACIWASKTSLSIVLRHHKHAKRIMWYSKCSFAKIYIHLTVV